MVQWVYEAAQKVNGVDKILIATDSAKYTTMWWVLAVMR